MATNHNLIQQVYVINPDQFGGGGGSGVSEVSIVSSIPLDVNVLNSCISICDVVDVNQFEVGGAAITLGQKTMANSYPVVIASDQSAITVSQATASNLNATVVGNKTNNATAPGVNNIGTLGAIANAVAPTWTEGNQVGLSSDLSGNLRVTSSNLAIKYSDSANLDAFDRLRISNPFTIFDSTTVETNGILLWDTSLTGAATSTWLQNQATTRLRCTTANGDVAIRQTREYFHYQPGHSMLVLMTGIMGVIKANVTQRIGYFDENNGIFWEQDGTNLKVALRSFVTGSPVTTYVNQSDWNIDKLDGTGVSGVTIDMSKEQIFFIDFQWLGTGRIRMGFVVNGIIYYCHQFLAANLVTDVWASTGTLPCRYEIRNTGVTASNTDLYAVCASVQSEGGYNPLGVVRSVDNGITSISVATTLIPLISIRLKPANIRATVIPLTASIHIINNADINWKLILNPTTLTTPTWTDVSSTSVTQFDVASTAVSGGEVIASGYAVQGAASPEINSALKLVSNIAGTSDILTMAAIRIGGTSANTLAEISYRELF